MSGGRCRHESRRRRGGGAWQGRRRAAEPCSRAQTLPWAVSSLMALFSRLWTRLLDCAFLTPPPPASVSRTRPGTHGSSSLSMRGHATWPGAELRTQRARERARATERRTSRHQTRRNSGRFRARCAPGGHRARIAVPVRVLLRPRGQRVRSGGVMILRHARLVCARVCGHRCSRRRQLRQRIRARCPRCSNSIRGSHRRTAFGKLCQEGCARQVGTTPPASLAIALPSVLALPYLSMPPFSPLLAYLVYLATSISVLGRAGALAPSPPRFLLAPSSPVRSRSPCVSLPSTPTFFLTRALSLHPSPPSLPPPALLPRYCTALNGGTPTKQSNQSKRS